MTNEEELSSAFDNMNLSNPKKFVKDFLNKDGECNFLARDFNHYGYDTLPVYAQYSSGDGIFRSDGDLGKVYKFCRFSKKFPSDIGKIKRIISRSWEDNITEEEITMLKNDHDELIEGDLWPGTKGVKYIKFYGLSPKSLNDEGIRKDILIAIKKLPCDSCGTTHSIECDHKNSLWNDPRIRKKETQSINDFQPLCKHCNDTKRQSDTRLRIEGKRQPAPGYPNVPFTVGDETYDPTDPLWYVGTYWGDVRAFKAKLKII